MSKPSPRKQKKQKERQRQEKAKKLAADKRQVLLARKSEYAEKYPDFRFDTANGDPEFVEVVKKAVAQINFDDESVFPPGEAEIYRRMKREGANRGLSILEQVMAKAKEEGTQPADAYFCFSLGQAVFDLIGEAELLKYIPFNDVRFFQAGHHIFVSFDSLLRTKGSGGTVYYSRKKPTIEIDGEKKLVAFSKHAIDRMCDRIQTLWKMYTGLGEVFGFLSQCVYFERCDLDGAQLAFTFYGLCNEPICAEYLYVKEVLGEGNVDPSKGKCYYRVGYCPAVVEGDFIKAKTLLFPGFATTPEYRAILRSSFSREKKQAMIEKTRHLDADALFVSQDFSLIKCFHDHGIPQVVQLRQPVFELS
jgi:hypothetical protein